MATTGHGMKIFASALPLSLSFLSIGVVIFFFLLPVTFSYPKLLHFPVTFFLLPFPAILILHPNCNFVYSCLFRLLCYFHCYFSLFLLSFPKSVTFSYRYFLFRSSSHTTLTVPPVYDYLAVYTAAITFTQIRGKRTHRGIIVSHH